MAQPDRRHSETARPHSLRALPSYQQRRSSQWVQLNNGALLRRLSQVLGYGDSLGTVLVDELTFADHAGRRDMEFARTLAVKVRAGGQPLFCAATRRPQS